MARKAFWVGQAVLKVFILALALSLDVFAVSVGVGVRALSPRRKLQIGLTFASAEVTMIVVGSLLGLAAGHFIGDYAGYIGFAALFGVGLYMMRESRTQLTESSRLDLTRGKGLLFASLALSLDSLGVGFSILYIGVPMPVSLVIVGCVSLSATSLGLTVGRTLGQFAERYAAFMGGLLLALTGIAFALLKALRVG